MCMCACGCIIVYNVHLYVTEMLTKLLMLACLTQAAVAVTENNAPEINNDKMWDCTLQSDICNIRFVVEPFMSMTYHNIKADNRKLVGCRANFTDKREPNILRDTENCNDASISSLQPPITTDGEFRPLITINGHMPGPTIIARQNQRLNITVYNELPNVEGISIHWHGMHQRRTTSMDGVAFISQNPILPYQFYTYDFLAFPAGTHWYHAHSGAHRTDGLYGALIIEDILPGDLYDEDHPEQHTLLLMDWQKEASIDLFYQIRSSLAFFTDTYEQYDEARAPDYSQVGPIPFWSGIINDKGRHYYNLPDSEQHNNADLNVFDVQMGRRYRFRLIGAQALYAYKFSIQDHPLTVVATDGSRIDSITEVNYVIVNTGERFDVIVNANNSIGNYWILAETLESVGGMPFNNPINTHKAEAVLHYDGAPAYDRRDPAFSTMPSRSWNCSEMPCRFVNCPYRSDDVECINVDNFTDSLGEKENIEKAINVTDVDSRFYNFGFDGEQSTQGSSVDGINFRFPSVLPSGSSEFSQQVCKGRGCDHKETKHCACTHVIDITDVDDGRAVELVLTNYPNKITVDPESSHPIHLHGHYFYVVKIGYPEYDDESGYYVSPNPDITCTVDATNETCERFITVTGKNAQTVKWTDGKRPDLNFDDLVAKDTVIVPFGGYTVIRFIADNPGWWLLHCHIEIHQLEGMATVVREGRQGKQYLLQ